MTILWNLGFMGLIGWKAKDHIPCFSIALFVKSFVILQVFNTNYIGMLNKKHKVASERDQPETHACKLLYLLFQGLL